MKKIAVNLGKRSYQILIGSGILFSLAPILNRLNLGKLAVVVTNPTIKRLYGSLMIKALRSLRFKVHFIQVPDTEQSKSFKQCLNLIEQFASLDKGRGIFAIACGGGVIGDLTGFAASVYRRGVPLIQIPTTLLAQVDSSVGGKVAIDLPYGKNLVGSFYQPRLVLSELRFLNSLRPTQIKEALAEIIKYGVICDAGLFEFLENHLEQIQNLDRLKLQHIIETCSKIKARIVEQDETDREGKRVLLNLGHTTAHALEAAAGFSTEYSHGYAVGLGMLVAAELAGQLRLCSQNTRERIAALIKRAGLPTKISGLKIKDILAHQAFDKKFSAGKNRFVLPVRIGKVVVKENIPKSRIAQAIRSII